MVTSIRSIENVVEGQLCTGCGVCSSVEPHRFRMDDAPKYGRRPFVKDGAEAESGEALKACPGIMLEHTFDREDSELDPNLVDAWGPVYDVWEGYATQPAIRFAGSSGGAATALALYCIEAGGREGALHTAARRDAPFLNETIISTERDQLLNATGSRYAPSSPGDGLIHVLNTPGEYVFIGKPCDIAGFNRAAALIPNLRQKVTLTLAFFCAGTPSTQGNLELLKREGVNDPKSLLSLRYRGNGWPGLWTAVFRTKNGKEDQVQTTYADSWGYLQRYRQWRCYICPDHSGEFADISVGDPWYRKPAPGEQGKSLIVARTKKGREAIMAAADAGYIVLEKKDPNLLPRSQPNLLEARGALWARLLVLRFFGAPTPTYKGFKLFQFWKQNLNRQKKISSFLGTFKRIFVKKLRHPVSITDLQNK